MEKFTFNGSFNRVTITDSGVYIDGRQIESFDNSKSKDISVVINGDVVDIHCDGSVTCQNVDGSIDAGGSVTCGDVVGDIDAGGSVRCGNVKGNVDAGGSIHMSR